MKCAVDFLAIVFCFAVAGTPVYAAQQDGRHGRTQGNNMNSIGKFFEKADINHDGVLTREEAEKSLDLSNQFSDMDINQDGKVTRQEMIASIKMKRKHYGRNTAKLH